MERTFEATLVEQCAPTLEGIKPASLFRWQGGCAQALVSRWAGELAPFGIAVRILKVCPRTGACLIYLYRSCWNSSRTVSVWSRNFPMRSAYFWGILWRMW